MQIESLRAATLWVISVDFRLLARWYGRGSGSVSAIRLQSGRAHISDWGEAGSASQRSRAVWWSQGARGYGPANSDTRRCPL